MLIMNTVSSVIRFRLIRLVIFISSIIIHGAFLFILTGRSLMVLQCECHVLYHFYALLVFETLHDTFMYYSVALNIGVDLSSNPCSAQFELSLSLCRHRCTGKLVCRRLFFQLSNGFELNSSWPLFGISSKSAFVQ